MQTEQYINQERVKINFGKLLLHYSLDYMTPVPVAFHPNFLETICSFICKQAAWLIISLMGGA
jgi:hypothetical protein